MSSSGVLMLEDRERERAAIQAAVAFNAQHQKALSFKEFLDVRYKIPEAMLESHSVNWVWRPSPLNLLCPSGEFILEQHRIQASTVEQWYLGLPEDGNAQHKVCIETALCHSLLWIFSAFHRVCTAIPFESNGIPKPDVYVSTCGIPARPVMVALVDMENLMSVDHPPDVVLDRLFHNMRLTNTRLGILTCLQQTWICEWTGKQRLRISEAIEAPAKAIGYALEMFQQRDSSSANGTAAPFISYQETLAFFRSVFLNSDGLVFNFDIKPVKTILRTMCSLLKVRFADQIVNGAKSFDLSNLENARKLLPVDRRCSLITLRGTYKGQPVVMKIRDLSCPWWYGFEGSLARMAVEVNTYLSVSKVSSKFAELVSWGFMCGATFAYVMLSDEGKARHERVQDREPWLHKCPGKVAALGSVKEALFLLHKRGILHGDLHVSKVVLKQVGDGWVAKLVGFGEARYADPDSLEGSQEFALEKVKLGKVLDGLIHTDMP